MPSPPGPNTVQAQTYFLELLQDGSLKASFLKEHFSPTEEKQTLTAQHSLTCYINSSVQSYVWNSYSLQDFFFLYTVFLTHWFNTFNE